MPDVYADVRALDLRHVLAFLGVSTQWKSRKAATEWYGPCPLHEAKRNTTSFSFDAEGRFNCFSCGKKGRGAIDLTMALKGLGFREAVELLQSHLGNIIAQQAAKPQIKQIQEARAETERTENPPFKGQYQKYFVPSEWLSKRGFAPETLDCFGVGQYDNPKRQSAYKGKILLPVRRWVDGELVGYLARTPEPEDGEPKYIWPKGFAKHLEVFGAFQLKEKGPQRVLYVVESPFAVMKFHQLGFPAVSCFGWSVSDEQCRILSELARGVVFLPDRNKYAEARAVAGALAQRVWVKMPELPEGIDDPEHLSLEQIRALTGV